MNPIVCLIVGALAGALASMGMGGGFILLIALALFTDNAELDAQGLNLMFFLPVIALSVVMHLKNRLIDLRMALVFGAAGSLTAALGWMLAKDLPSEKLRALFALFLIGVGLRDLLSRPKKPDSGKL